MPSSIATFNWAARQENIKNSFLLIATSKIKDNEDVYLFLDIDGVLHSTDAAVLLDGKPAPGTFVWFKYLKEALDKFPKLKVVLHSSWRFCWKTKEEVLDNLPKELSDRIIDFTDVGIYQRWESIRDYCLQTGAKNIIILDDDRGAFPYELPYLIWCKSTLGLSDSRVREELFRRLDKFFPKEDLSPDVKI